MSHGVGCGDAIAAARMNYLAALLTKEGKWSRPDLVAGCYNLAQRALVVDRWTLARDTRSLDRSKP